MSSKAFTRAIHQMGSAVSSSSPSRDQMQASMSADHMPTQMSRYDDDGEWNIKNRKKSHLMPWHHPLR